MLLLNLLINGIIFGAELGIAAFGFAIIFYAAKELHFAYGALMAASGYLGYLFIASWNFPPILGVVLALVISVLVGVLIQKRLYSPLGNHLSILLISLGLSIVIENVLQIAFGANDVVLAGNVLGKVFTIGGMNFRLIDFVSVSLFVLLWIAISYMLHRHKLGMGIRVVMSDPEMSRFIGINTKKIKLFAYGFGSALGGVAGLLMLADSGLRPSIGFEAVTFAFMITLVGFGNMNRVAVWSILIGLLMNLSSWQLPTQFQTLIVFGLMLIYMFVRNRNSLQVA